MLEAGIALVALTSMEIVLGIDNIVFITILTSRLPLEQQPKARKVGLALALITRLLLLMSLSWILGLTKPIFTLHFLDSWLTQLDMSEEARIEIVEFSVRKLILLTGGLFLIFKSVREIHERIEGEEHSQSSRGAAKFTSVVIQIAILDIVFSLDSVITAVGMVDEMAVMVLAIVITVGVMLFAARPIGEFVDRHPTIKMLALSFLIVIGVALVADGAGFHIPKGYIYFAMAFSVVVEMLNIRMRARTRAVQLRRPDRP